WMKKNPMKPPTTPKETQMTIDRATFYSEYRKEFGSIKTQGTVHTINSILTRAEREQTPVPHLAYMFATALHEARSAQYRYDFYPIMERGSYTYITNQYWKNTRVRGWLGNKSIEDAWNFRGRGLVQITGRTNYERFGIDKNPDAALNPDLAVSIMFEGMTKGIFTGKALRHYLNPEKKDYWNARRIINGTDKAGL